MTGWLTLGSICIGAYWVAVYNDASALLRWAALVARCERRMRVRAIALADARDAFRRSRDWHLREL